MNQIICDICGIAYPESDDRCPTCGYPRQGGEKIVAAGAVAAPQAKVKGGRFSAKNVKKRWMEQQNAAQAAAAAAEVPEEQEEKRGNPNRPLWITIILLLLAIAMISTYIGIRFGQGLGQFLPAQTTVPTTAAPTETTVPPTVPCAAVTLDTAVIALDEAGQTHPIGLRVIPENTTDVVLFQSADPAVAEVTEEGVLTAVGPGQTTVTITCGQIVRECTVVCWIQEETTVPTAPPETTAATEPPRVNQPAELTLDQSDVSCFTRNEAFTLYVRLGGESVSRSKVTWRSSDDKVATVEKGNVVAVGAGTATITAEYQGKKASCIVRCRFENQQATEETKAQENKASWKASHTDVSIAVGESFRLTVKNADGKTADTIWTQSTEGVVAVDGKTITGKAPGTVTLTTTVDGVTMTCIVRVK